MIINENQNIWDLLLTSTGSIYNILDFLKEHQISSLQEDLTGKNLNIKFLENEYSQRNRINQYCISTKDFNRFEDLKETLAPFNKGFNDGFEIYETNTFRSVKSGDWEDLETWEIASNGGGLDATSWEVASILPDINSTVIINANTSVKLNTNTDIKDLIMDSTLDIPNRLDLGKNSILLWGILASVEWSGVAWEYGNIGLAPFINAIENEGEIRFKGKTDRIIIDSEKGFGANKNVYGYNLVIDFEAGKKAFVQKTIRTGNLIVENGILDLRDYTDLTGGVEIRISGMDETGGGENIGGYVLVKEGAELYYSEFKKNGYKVSKPYISLENFIIEGVINGSYIGNTISTKNYEINHAKFGDLWSPHGSPQYNYIFGAYGVAEEQPIITIKKLEFVNGDMLDFIYLERTVKVVQELILNKNDKQNYLVKNGFEIEFETDANIRIQKDITASNEFIESTKLELMPNNLIVKNGKTLTLNTNLNIRGNIILEGTGTINYNGFTITENYT